MHRTDTDVDAFLLSLDGVHAETMRGLDAVIAPVLEGCERMLWEGVFWGGTVQQIIGYGGIVQPRSKGDDVEWFVKVGSAAINIASLDAVNVDGLRALVQRAREFTPAVT